MGKNNKKFTYEEVKNYFEEHECELLETEYVNNGTRMKYRCICKEISHIRFNDFKLGKRCRKCAIKNRNNGKIPDEELLSKMEQFIAEIGRMPTHKEINSCGYLLRELSFFI